MTLRFILGRAGTGKTRLCLEEIREKLRRAPDGPPLVFLVPEQATFQIEYALTLTPGLSGMFRAQVFSFRRLAWRVFSEVGGAARPHVGDVGKRMLLARILARRRDELRLFGRSAGRYGFSDTLAGALSEFKTYLVTPEALERTGFMLPGTVETDSLQAKLKDLRLLYMDFERELAGRYIDPDDYLTLLAGRLGESPTLRRSEVWVDGFAGFTPQEYAVLGALLKTAARVNVALCLDPRSGRHEDRELFQVTRGTRARLAELALKSGVKLARPVELAAPPARFRANPAVAHLEREFFRRPTQKFAGVPENLRLVAAASRRAEVDGAAREILRLSRERGWRWRDVSLVVRNLADYHELVATVFTDYGIPCFIDRKRPVRHHPLVELVRSALETVTGNWAYDPVFRYLKTDLVPVSRADVDLLENYVLAHGIKGAKWAEPDDWHYRHPGALTRPANAGIPRECPEDVPADCDWYLREKVNRVRRRATRHLLDFQRRVQTAGTVRGFTAALYDLLTALDVPGRIEEWSREAETEGRLETAREHRQLWARVVELFDQVVEVLGDEALTAEEFGRVLNSGMDGMQLALIPPALDQVLVSSLERSRNPDVRAAFILGVSEGVLPGRHGDTGLFTDREREALLAAGMEVAPDNHRKVYEEQYLVYIALTRAGDYLWVSYPLADEEGGALAPSSVIPRLREFFPGLVEETLALEPEGSVPGADLPYVTAPGRTLGFLVTRLRDWKSGVPVDPVWWSVFNWFAGDGGRREQCATALAGLFFENREPPLDPELVSGLYGSPLVASVSRLEKFRGCPFAHFAHYALRLKERDVCRLGAPDIGRFFHEALRAFDGRLRESGVEWHALESAECARLASEVVEELAPQLQSEILLSTSRHQFLTGKLERVVQRTAEVMAAHARQSSFRPVAVEVPFGPGQAVPGPSYPLHGGGQVELAGRVDRVDVAHTEKAAYLRVIDYKAGPRSLALDDVYYGLNLQLLVYLDACLGGAAALAGRECLPAGAFYFRVQNPLLKGGTPLPPADVEALLLREFRMQGLVLGDPALLRLMDGAIAGESVIVPAGIKKDGTAKKKPAVVSAAQFGRLLEHVRRVVAETAAEIQGGAVGIAPYRKGQTHACRYCAFKPLCAFDPLLESNRYRLLRGLPRAEMWRLLGLGGEEEPADE